MPSDQTTVDIKSGNLFPFQFLVLGVVILIAGIAVVVPHVIIGSLLIVGSVMILTAHEGTEITPAAKTYREYNSVLFLKTGKQKKYKSIEKIFVNPVKRSQKMYTPRTLHSSTFSTVEYNAFLKFSDGEKIFLVSDRNKARLINRLKHTAERLNIPLQDNTAGH